MLLKICQESERVVLHHCEIKYWNFVYNSAVCQILFVDRTKMSTLNKVFVFVEYVAYIKIKFAASIENQNLKHRL